MPRKKKAEAPKWDAPASPTVAELDARIAGAQWSNTGIVRFPASGIVPFAASNAIANCLPGTTLHLGDGRRLAFGESAEVSAELADFLRGRGQAK